VLPGNPILHRLSRRGDDIEGAGALSAASLQIATKYADKRATGAAQPCRTGPPDASAWNSPPDGFRACLP
jgi:hypothetical protein